MKFANYFFSTILYLILPLSVCGQQFSITGAVFDETSQPIAYSNIIILQIQDSTIVAGTTSNEEGQFIFNNIKANTYIIKASFIGYEDNYRTIMVNADLKLPVIVLKESIEALSEIEITYRKPTFKREPDRLIFNVEKTALSEGNMMEVLRSTPGVLVLNNKIIVKGSTPTVYINDRKVHISANEISELLEGSSASNIKSIEVITNPPARYDAESGVVLNIVMSKNLVTGYNGSIFTNYTQGVFPKTNHGMSNYFKGSNISLFANYSYNNKKIDRIDRETINYPNQLWVSDRDRNTWSETHNFNLNFDWDLSKSSTLSLSANTQFLPYYKYITKDNTQITPIVNNAIASFNSFNLSRDKKHNLGFDLDYVHRFKNNGRFSINSHYTTYDYRRKQHVNSDYFLGNASFFETIMFKTRSDQNTEIITSQLDYTLPIGGSATFEVGLKFSNVKTESGIIHTDIIGNTEVLNSANTDIFKYIEDVYAGYLSYANKWNKWSLSTGLRVEQTNIEANSKLTNENNDQNYLEWFPTANLGYQVSENVNIYTNYKRSITRPNYSALNPFRYYLNDNTYVTGNPKLKPIFIDRIKLGININDTFIIETYYRKYNNNIFEIPFQDNVNNTLAYSSVNIDFTVEIGLDIEAYFDIGDKWNVYLGSSFYNYNDNATLFNNTIKRDKWSNYTIFSNNFSFLKDNSLTANFALSYIHQNVQGLQDVDTTIFTDLSLRKSIFKGKGAISLSFSDLLNKQNFLVKTQLFDQSSPFYQNSTNYTNLDDRYIKLGFRYKFGNTKLSTNERSSSIDERDRLKINH